MRRPHSQSHVTHQSSGHQTNQIYFIFIFTRRKAYKLSRMVPRIRRLHPTCHVILRSRRHVTFIQYVVYIRFTSSWSSLLKTDRFQMVMTTLKMCSLYKGSFYGEVLLSGWADWLSDRNNKFLCLYKAYSISPDVTHVHNHVIKISLTLC